MGGKIWRGKMSGKIWREKMGGKILAGKNEWQETH
jgi:hypothetical protein